MNNANRSDKNLKTRCPSSESNLNKDISFRKKKFRISQERSKKIFE